MSRPQAQKALMHRVFDRVVPVYDLLNHLLSLRQDVHWRRLTAGCLRPGPTGRVLDVATGTADLALEAAKRPHRPLVVGLDLLPSMLARARQKVARNGARVRLLAGDGNLLPFAPASFDAVTIAFGIRNIPARVRAMAEMGRVLAPGGRLYVLELASPQRPWLRAIYRTYLTRILTRLGGLLSGDGASYQYLAQTILAFPGPEQFQQEMIQAGLIRPRSLPLTGGIAWLHVAEKGL